MDKEHNFQEEVVSFWSVTKRKKDGGRVVQLSNPESDTLLNTLRINDMFLMGTNDLEQDLNLELRSYLKSHLYRVQKLSSKFYEFRLAQKRASIIKDAPEYIRSNNFGESKTGWLTYNPVKVEVNIVGQIIKKKKKYKNESNSFLVKILLLLIRL